VKKTEKIKIFKNIPNMTFYVRISTKISKSPGKQLAKAQGSPGVDFGPETR
jgi:hypothetical protein